MIIRLNKKEIIGIVVIMFLFISASLLSKIFSSEINSLVQVEGYSGLILYVAITSIGVLIAPVSTLPLLPIAVTIWGPVVAALLTIIGWEIGSLLAFKFARKFGKQVVSKVANISKLERIANLISKKNLFIMVVLFRFTLPVDVLSYALGLFTSMSFSAYLLATLIGITPFAFIFSYFSQVPIEVQIIMGIIALFFFIFVYNKIRKSIVKSLNEN